MHSTCVEVFEWFRKLKVWICIFLYFCMLFLNSEVSFQVIFFIFHSNAQLFMAIEIEDHKSCEIYHRHYTCPVLNSNLHFHYETGRVNI